MTTHRHPCATGQMQDLGDDQNKFPIANYKQSIIRTALDLIPDPQGSGKRFCESCDIGGNGLRNLVEVFDRQAQIFRKCTVTIDNAENRAVWTMITASDSASIARSADRIDLTDNSTTNPVVRTLLHKPDKLMPQHTSVRIVPPDQFEIRIAAARPAIP